MIFRGGGDEEGDLETTRLLTGYLRRGPDT